MEVPDRWSAASFRIISAELDLAELEKTLGVPATQAHLKGQRSRSGVVFRQSMWSLKSPLPKSETLDRHLEWLLDRLEPKAEEIRSMSRAYKLDFFCGFCSAHGQGGFVLDGVLLARLARLGVPLGLDLYPPGPAEEQDDEVVAIRPN
jgi:Domain of unknown function (DUF4279)